MGIYFLSPTKQKMGPPKIVNIEPARKEPGERSAPPAKRSKPRIPVDYSTALSNAFNQEVQGMIQDLGITVNTNSKPQVWFSEPWIAKGGMLGTFTVDSYKFCAAIKGKICYVEHFSSNDRLLYFETVRRNFTLPLSQLNTNAALNTAINWLNRAHMDTSGLIQNASVKVRCMLVGDDQFVPLYWVVWGKDGKPYAQVTFFAPDNTLVQLRVEEDAYNKRKRFFDYNFD